MICGHHDIGYIGWGIDPTLCQSIELCSSFMQEYSIQIIIPSFTNSIYRAMKFLIEMTWMGTKIRTMRLGIEQAFW